MQAGTRRVVLLDQIRGLSILLMVFYHGAYDLIFLFGVQINLFFSPEMMWLQSFFASLFLLISGIVSNYSRSNLKRGALCFGVALLMTLVTWIFVPDELILWGILHLMGFSMILYGLVGKGLQKLPKVPMAIVFLILFFVTFHVQSGYIGLFGQRFFTLPSTLYDTSWLFWLGFPGRSFMSSDYFPVLPWLFMFLFGASIGPWFKENRAPEFFYSGIPGPVGRFFSFCGKHSLWIYLLHQPILFGLFTLILG